MGSRLCAAMAVRPETNGDFLKPICKGDLLMANGTDSAVPAPLAERAVMHCS